MENPILDQLWEEALKRGQYLDEVNILRAQGRKPALNPHPLWLEVRAAALKERREGLSEEHEVHAKVLETLGTLLTGRKLTDLFSGESLVPLALLMDGKIDRVNLLDSGESNAPQIAQHLIQKFKLTGATLDKTKVPSLDLRPFLRKSSQVTIINSGLVLPPELRRPDLATMSPQEQNNPRLFRARHLTVAPTSPIHRWSGVLNGLDDCRAGTVLHAFDAPFHPADDKALHDYLAAETKQARGGWEIVQERKIEEELNLWHFQLEKRN